MEDIKKRLYVKKDLHTEGVYKWIRGKINTKRDIHRGGTHTHK